MSKSQRQWADDTKIERDFHKEKQGLCGIMWVYSTDEILKPSCKTVHWKWGLQQTPGHMLS